MKKTPAKRPVNKKKKTGSWLKAIVFALLIVLIIRVFFLQTIVMQSSTMESNLFSGDVVVINKVAYGPRIPITPFSVPFSPIRTENTSPKYFSDWFQIPYYRLPGFSNFSRNDIIAFNYPEEQSIPIDKKLVYLKRCVALPGDTLKIINNKLIINHKTVQVDNIQFKYKISCKNRNLPHDFFSKYNINEGGLVSKYGEYELYLTNKQADDLNKNAEILSIEIDSSAIMHNDGDLYPLGKFNWTHGNYGPVIIPKTGKTIRLNINNISVYDSLITRYEGKKLELKGSDIYINDKKVDRYTFKNNYFFVLDDNRDNSKDSRHWGFLPESHIIGKASFVLFSANPQKKAFKKIRWSRFFKPIK
jgi:signal peptidase I